MCFPVARCDRMAISMQWLLHNHFNRSWQSHCLERIISQKTDYELKSSNYYLISRFFHKKTDFVTQKTDFGKIFLLAHTKMLKTFDVVELRAKFFLHDTRTFYSNNKIERFFHFRKPTGWKFDFNFFFRWFLRKTPPCDQFLSENSLFS